ncbi:TetR/AcrR family transcriptional regulator [Anaerocolumna xylanovorans]|uniref:Transcriptional regulator, TetR family n=1 Tax=Anaerocolumna xylanovorans DSM 12503 TaxID=1121345 RepID=A0A1M7YLV3_9FIRM|nr:TetR/AcrR family transcriptional regulator [Anaerocolumna xylanovorans]SHO53591.1 transcriptional regulator, TetR family [Anaerocolumna xylanovorans DSM 12503]
MKDEKETRKKLLISAKKEFMEKGYLQASLRNICKDAGVTTGALYFFFQDKEDLFASLVQEPLDKMYALVMKHYEDERNQLQGGSMEMDSSDEDYEMVTQVIHYLYQYSSEFQLILAKSYGSRFENSIERFVAITQQHYRILLDQMAEKKHIQRVDDFVIHWIAHMHIDIFVHMIKHETSEKEAIGHMSLIIKYLFKGWYGMFEGLEKK